MKDDELSFMVVALIAAFGAGTFFGCIMSYADVAARACP